MITITFPDGAQSVFENHLTVADVAKHISPGLARSAIAARVNGNLVDLSTLIVSDSQVTLLTKHPANFVDKADALFIVRHSTAHLLAYAVKQLFPSACLAIGPVIEDGFYYDFDYDRPFTPDDLKKIEKRMHELASLNEEVSYKIFTRDDAADYFRLKGEKYKVEIIEGIPEHEFVKIYAHGKFEDLCRGPHVPELGKLAVFKLMKVSGAYWRGNSRAQQLQRIYGTAWLTQKDQDDYLLRIEEAEKRDHRKLGKFLDFFHWQDDAPGMTFWHPRGWILWKIIEDYMRAKLQVAGYSEVRTPIIMDRALWERSGHWDNYRDNMFITESEKRDYAIKPMSCPGHVEIFNQSLRSYRDLPLRLSEFGMCHRNEPSGALHGLLRVRGLVQDDGHIFCTPEQIVEEASAFHQLAMEVYSDFGFSDVVVKLALRPEMRSGSEQVWNRAEDGLRIALAKCEVVYDELPGEGAFYGPKIEYHIKDALGRSWQCGTLQLDLVLPGRLQAEYVAADNTRQHPVMLHRAIFGSFERFIGILIEHYAGILPIWLAPVQVVVLNISESQQSYANNVLKFLKRFGVRAICDLRNQKIGYRIRENVIQKIPFLLTVGEIEMANGTVSVRQRGQDKAVTFDLQEFCNKFFK